MFIRSFRDVCPNLHWLETLEQAKAIIEAWWQNYNETPPHLTLSDLSLVEHVQSRQNRKRHHPDVRMPVFPVDAPKPVLSLIDVPALNGPRQPAALRALSSGCTAFTQCCI